MQDVPRIDRRSFESNETKVAFGGIEAEVLELTFAAEDQAGGALLVVELDADGDLIGHFFGRFALVKAERSVAKTCAHTVNDDAARALSPRAAEFGFPFRGI